MAQSALTGLFLTDCGSLQARYFDCAGHGIRYASGDLYTALPRTAADYCAPHLCCVFHSGSPAPESMAMTSDEGFVRVLAASSYWVCARRVEEQGT